MFDIFGIREKREEKRKAKEAKLLAIAEEKRKKYRERKEKIDAYLTEYEKKDNERRSKLYLERKKRIENLNNKCPKCGSTNVIHNIVRGKGEIHGESHSSYSSSSSSFLFGHTSSGYGSGHGKIDGEFDTLPVNKCKKCDHEWNIEKAKYPDRENIFSRFDDYSPICLYYRIEEYFKLKYNPYDEKEPCNSLEEKREKYLEKCADNYHLKVYRNIPRYMVEVALYEGISNFLYHEDNEEMFNFHKGDDRYSYTMTDELWEVVKKIIKWEGTEE